jgi:hypothetical protein
MSEGFLRRMLKPGPDFSHFLFSVHSAFLFSFLLYSISEEFQCLKINFLLRCQKCVRKNGKHFQHLQGSGQARFAMPPGCRYDSCARNVDVSAPWREEVSNPFAWAEGPRWWHCTSRSTLALIVFLHLASIFFKILQELISLNCK